MWSVSSPKSIFLFAVLFDNTEKQELAAILKARPNAPHRALTHAFAVPGGQRLSRRREGVRFCGHLRCYGHVDGGNGRLEAYESDGGGLQEGL